jgi:tetratricopeptide (TPR) repeat protein
MSLQPENTQVVVPSLDERKLETEIRLREAEIALKRDELNAQIARDSRTRWSPATTTVLVAIAGVLGSVIGVLLQSQAQLQLERQKLQSDLILKVIETGNATEAAQNLRFFVKAGLIHDESGLISAAVASSEAPPVLPAGPYMKELSAAVGAEERFYALGDAAKEALERGYLAEAEKFAEEQATLLPGFKSNWNYGNAVQDTNLVLGRIAVRQGDIEAAKRYLLLAGETPGSPQLDTFGPNMSLAKDLLEKGEREVVLQYFELCRKFWEMHSGRLDVWRSAVQAGTIPDFGANLSY